MSRLSIHILVAIGAITCVAMGSAFAWSNIVVSAGAAPSADASPYAAEADFDQAFADVASGRRDLMLIAHGKLDRTARYTFGGAVDVNRDRKGDRLPVLGSVLGGAAASDLAKGTNGVSARQKTLEIENTTPSPQPSPVRLRNCEPVASPFADPALSKIIGRCMV